jgi:hypothetical protein
MTKEELLKAIKSPEWTGMEFKQCQFHVTNLSKLTKYYPHKQAWSLSEDIVQQIDKSMTDVESDQATGQVTGQATDQVTGQATDQVTGQVTGQALYDKKQEIPRLNPRLEEGIVLMKYPDKPKHPKQKYYLSDYGKELLQAMQGEH